MPIYSQILDKKWAGVILYNYKKRRGDPNGAENQEPEKEKFKQAIRRFL